jgi:hypothetical protein
VHERHVRLVLKTPWKFICEANKMWVLAFRSGF